MKITNQHIVILGAGYAGLLATLRLTRLTRGCGLNAQITLINRLDVFVERIRLHEQAVRKPARVVALPALLRKTGSAFVQGCVQSLDVRNKCVHLETSSGTQAIPYDKLVYALGSFAEEVQAMREVFYRRVGRWPAEFVVPQAARKLRIPALVVHDERDPVVPFAHGEAYAHALSNARMLKTNGLGHTAILRDVEVISAVVAFLRS
jgi:pimeloyl-ACP methyl ester carboxylesterase